MPDSGIFRGVTIVTTSSTHHILYRSLRSLWSSVGDSLCTISYLWVNNDHLLFYRFNPMPLNCETVRFCLPYVTDHMHWFYKLLPSQLVIASFYFRFRMVRLQLHILLKSICLHINFNYFPTQDHFVNGTQQSFVLSLIFDSHTPFHISFACGRIAWSEKFSTPIHLLFLKVLHAVSHFILVALVRKKWLAF